MAGVAGTAEDEMSYLEFLEALSAVASYKNANPYRPFSQRLQQFLHNSLFPLARTQRKKS